MAARSTLVSKMGRPRGFSEEAALEAAMRVFWEKGYEGATLTDLTTAMGINRSSLYTIFGDKEALFRRSIARYATGPAGYILQSMNEPTARAVVEALLRGAVNLLGDPRNPRGCLFNQGALACGTESQGARLSMIELRKQGEAVLQERFERARAEGDLPRSINPGSLSRYVAILVNGLGIQAANGASREEMQSIAALAMKALPF